MRHEMSRSTKTNRMVISWSWEELDEQDRTTHLLKLPRSAASAARSASESRAPPSARTHQSGVRDLPHDTQTEGRERWGRGITWGGDAGEVDEYGGEPREDGRCERQREHPQRRSRPRRHASAVCRLLPEQEGEVWGTPAHASVC